MSGPFAVPGPRWFSIPASRPFLTDLAAGLLDALTADGPERLADALLLVPTRRGARELAHAFVAAADGRAVLLPQIRAVGDLDEGEPPFEPGDLALDLPPAVSPLRRRFELARLVLEHEDDLGRPLDASGALEMADALAAVFDSLTLEGVTDADEKIERLVEGEQARHWEISARFLAVAAKRWPERLAELDLLDPTERRVRLLGLLADRWTAAPPDRPLIAAGSTGTAPAAARLLGVVAAAPNGCVVLPGLDLDLADGAWAEVDDQHPQGAMKRLIDRHAPGRASVRVWPASSAAEPAARTARRRVVNEALRPAEATADWLDVIAELGPPAVAAGLTGLTVVKARAEETAAAAIALLLREVLETEGKTAALVTPDQALARRVSAALSRWGIEADSSAGAALSRFPVGTLLSALLRLAEDPLDPVALLAVAKHRDAELDARFVGRLERQALRGGRPRTWDEIAARLARDDRRTFAHSSDGEEPESVAESNVEPDAGASAARGSRAEADLAELARFRAILTAWADVFARPVAVPAAARALAAAVEALCGAVAPWRGQAGERAAELLADLIGEAAPLPDVDAAAFRQLVESLLGAETVRTGGSTHPRIRILGAIEARLVRADRVILAGLEDGVWPRGAPVDPFLSRPMRKALGLPSPERRIGLSAHDFAQAACAEEVVLVHCERRGGQPAVESRWLWRLRMLAEGAGAALPTRPELADWVRALDRIDVVPETLRTAARPEPRPPLSARPRKLSVTTVEKWVRDPYAVYARHVLDLKALDRPDERAEARARGTAIHAAVERLAKSWGERDPSAAAEAFAGWYLDGLRAAGVPDPALAREAVLARRAGVWLVELETRRRATGAEVRVELPGECVFQTAGGDFTLTVKADRIELKDGAAHVLDFKTGRIPTPTEIATDFSPQLTLTAGMLARGAWPELGCPKPGDLTYVQITGRATPGEEVTRVPAGESEAAAETAWAGLLGLIERYERVEEPYASRTAPRFATAPGGDYDHLARVREWSTAGDEEGGE